MENDVWRAALDVVEDVCDLPREQWATAIDARAGADARVATAARQLLDSLEVCPSGFLPADDLLTTEPTGADSHLRQPLREAGFELVEAIGRGNVAVVYRAHQRALDRDVAVKIFQPGLASTPQQLSRFRAEAESMARLRHPNIVAIHDHGRTDDALWIAMELVAGHDLAVEIERQFAGRGEPTLLHNRREPGFVSAVANLCAELADALQAAHDAGIIHRDVKPHNILLSEDGRARLVDFGLARDDLQAHMTRTGEVAGSPYYMSPEQVRGATDLDRRTDVYSLGVVLYQCLTNRLPHEGDSVAEVTHSILSREPKALRGQDQELPLDIDTICATAMAADRAHRYATAGDLAADLRRFANLQAIKATRRSRWQRWLDWLKRHRRAAALLGLFAVLLFAGVRFWMGVELERELGEQLDEVETALATADQESPSDEQLATLAALRGQTSRVVRVTLHQDTELAQRAREQEQRIEKLGRRLQQEAMATLLADAPSRTVRDELPDLSKQKELPPPPIATAFSPHLIDAIAQLEQASGLLPDDAELARQSQAETWYPRLCVDSDPPGAHVVLRKIEWVSGQHEPGRTIGRTPLRDHRVVPGYYRIMLVVPGHGFAERTRWLGNWNETLDLGTVQIPGTAEVTKDMAFIKAGRQPFIRTNKTVGTAQHGDFWIDKREVSFEEYARFFAAHDEAPALKPAFWTPEILKKYPKRPVVGASSLQARAYAEWVGKRLPTEVEWNAAARGQEGRPRPWGNDESLVARAAGLAPSKITQHRVLENFGRYSVDVDQQTFDTTPEGVAYLGGNVSEWTESPSSCFIGGRMFPLIGHRKVKGQSWRRQHPRLLHKWAELPGYQPLLEDALGFRCAKSSTPNLVK